MQLPDADGIVKFAPVARCQMCGHPADHGLTPHDFYDAEEGELAYKGSCNDCEGCQAYEELGVQK